MGFLDKAKEMFGMAKGSTDQAKALADEHASKLPGDMGDKVTGAVDKAEGIADKIPGMGDSEA